MWGGRVVFPSKIMCLQISLCQAWDSWNWDGDEIVHRPIIRLAHHSQTKKRYPIDIREFLTTTDNAVVGENLGELIHGLSPSDQSSFRSHSKEVSISGVDTSCSHSSICAICPRPISRPGARFVALSGMKRWRRAAVT